MQKQVRPRETGRVKDKAARHEPSGDQELSMTQKKTFAGQNMLHSSDAAVKGKYVDLFGERFYCIENYDHMAPFFMSVVSDSNHWMFVSSNGALTCGRRNPESALFPYYTEDKIHDSHDQTGPKTIIRVERDACDYL